MVSQRLPVLAKSRTSSRGTAMTKIPTACKLVIALLALSLMVLPVAARQLAGNLANATVLILRHADKPTHGSGLSAAGNARAIAYARYFHPFRADGSSISIEPNALFATKDSQESHRPRLTLEPLSESTGLPINTHFANGEEIALVAALRAQPQGQHILIAWHQGHIPNLLKGLGVDPATLLPEGKWPDDVYDWVIELSFDANGKLAASRRIVENLSAAP